MGDKNVVVQTSGKEKVGSPPEEKVEAEFDSKIIWSKDKSFDFNCISLVLEQYKADSAKGIVRFSAHS